MSAFRHDVDGQRWCRKTPDRRYSGLELSWRCCFRVQYAGPIFMRRAAFRYGGGITMAECAVCGSHVRDDVPNADTEHDGETYFFESAKCKEMFENDPDEYT